MNINNDHTRERMMLKFHILEVVAFTAKTIVEDSDLSPRYISDHILTECLTVLSDYDLCREDVWELREIIFNMVKTISFKPEY